MANTTFQGPVRSLGGFRSVTRDPVTGAITNVAIFGSVTSVPQLVVSGNVNVGTLPTTDPAIAGQLWNDAGTVKVSAGA